MATVTKVGLMSVREIITLLCDHGENIRDSRETLTAQMASETISIKKACTNLFNAINMFLEDEILMMYLRTALDATYNKNGVVIDQSTVRHNLVQSFYKDLEFISGKDLDKAIHFWILGNRVDSFISKGSNFNKIIQLLKSYYAKDLKEVIVCEFITFMEPSEPMDGEDPYTDSSKNPKPWSSSW